MKLIALIGWMMNKKPKLEERSFKMTRSVYKELCRAVTHYRMSPSVYVECLVVSDKVRRDIGET